MDTEGLAFFHAIVWDKSARGNGVGWRFRRNYEFQMVAHRRGGRLAWSEDGRAVPNIIRMTPPRDRQHPNEKPVELVTSYIEWTTGPCDLILDPFAGSGTTGVAAKRLGRKCILIEIEEKYCEVIKNRLANEPMPLFADDGNGKPKDVQRELAFSNEPA
jgi:site-specific DNA-methyltransferase (adenine-specific)